MSLKKYDPSNNFKIKTKKKVLKNAEDLLKARNKIIRAFESCLDDRPKNELENVIKKIKSDIDLNVIID